MRNRTLYVGGALAAAALFWWWRSRPDFGEPPGTSPVGEILNRDPACLLPDFAGRLQKVFNIMRAGGWDPMFWEGCRSPERAARLSQTGAGIALSLHIDGAAADVVSRADRWGNPAFFRALGRAVAEAGLYWGGDFGDSPHIQAVPVVAQGAFRQLTSRAAQDAFVQQYA